jgi:dihydroorotate dehydrogenase (fumarate)
VTARVRGAVDIPIVVKLPGQLTAPPVAVGAAAEAGADGVVMFNRHLGLDIDVERERPVMHGGYAGHGGPWAISLGLRWISAVSPDSPVPIAASGGVAGPADVVKYLLSGAAVVQVCTAVYVEGFGVIAKLRSGLEAWMKSKGYETIDEFRGKVSGGAILDVDSVDRSQERRYVIDPETCTGCKRCAEICIYGAPRPAGDGKKYAIGPECVGCGLCGELCPVGAIAVTE